MFEAFAFDLLLACSSVSKAATVLRLDWHSVHAMMDRGVERGMLRRNTEQVKRVGIDEKSFRREHNYISLMTDIDASRVLDIVDRRDEESADELWKTLPESQRTHIEAISIDMCGPYINATQDQALASLTTSFTLPNNPTNQSIN